MLRNGSMMSFWSFGWSQAEDKAEPSESENVPTLPGWNIEMEYIEIFNISMFFAISIYSF